MRLLLFFLFIFAPMLAPAQSCYVRLEDASGFNTDAYQDRLMDAACKLRAIFPSGLQDQFKVFDFGFYLHQETTKGGYPEVFTRKRLEADALSPYYLLFGKQTDASGIYTYFWVDIKLPATGKFVCLDLLSPTYRDGVSSKHQTIANNIHQKNGGTPVFYWEAEIGAMDSLGRFLLNLFDCCDPLMAKGQQQALSCDPCVGEPSKIVFEEDPSQKYGFDDRFKANGFYNKSVEFGQSDVVRVKTEPLEALKQVYFYGAAPRPDVLNSDPQLTIEVSPSKISPENPSLTLLSIKKGYSEVLGKCVNQGGKVLGLQDPVLGLKPFKLDVYCYQPKNITLGIRVVNLPGKKCDVCDFLNKSELEAYLNDIFRSAVVKIEVEILSDMEYDYDLPDYDNKKDGLLQTTGPIRVGEKGAITANCNDPMKEKMLFVIGNPTPAPLGRADASGVSEQGGRFGFIFPSLSKNKFRTIAHEVGHLLGISRHQQEIEYLMYAYTTEEDGKKMDLSEWRKIHDK